MKYILFVFLVFGLNYSFAQTNDDDKSPASSENDIENELKSNRRKIRINGAYIPKDINDAIVQLEKLSDGKSLEKFKNTPEQDVAKRLHFGLGRWMIVNWNFYGGSRFEKKLRDLGLGHPDDMADFMIVIFHRHLNGKELKAKDLAEDFHQKRLEEYRKKHKVLKVIKAKKK